MSARNGGSLVCVPMLPPRFVSASVAASQQLAFVDPNTNHAIIKVDNTTNVPFNIKRNTVRITTNDSFSVGSVWTADILHVPFGVSLLLCSIGVLANKKVY